YEILPDRTFRMVEGSEKLSREIIQFLVPDGRGGVWAGTTDHGLFVLRDGQCLPWPHPLNAEFRRYQLNKAISLKEGGWAIGTILNGVYILRPDGGLRYHLHRENGLQNNTVLALSEDRDGNLWVGLDRGIDFVGLHAPLTFFADQTGKVGTTYAAAQHEGNLYLGTNQGVFAAPAGGAFRLVEGTQGQVWDLQVQDGQLLCGHNSGTFLLSGGKASRISDITGGWCTVRVPLREGLLLQSTYTGLVVLERSAAGTWRLGWRVQGFGESLKKIVWDSAGYLWGSHAQKGLYRLRLSDDLRQVTEWRAFGPADGLPTDYHLDVAKKGGDVVLNARPSARIVRSGPAGVRFEHDPALEGARKYLGGQGSSSFLLDSNGLWMQHAGQSLPLPLQLVPEYEQVVALPDSSYLFCLENGYARLHASPWLAALSAKSGASVVVRSLDAQDGQHYVPTDRLTFDHGSGPLRFRFALPMFEHAPLFSWRLEGFSEQWSAWQENPEQEFFGLPPGDYTFRVRAEGVEGEAALRFSIASPWYASGWAWAAYAALGLGLLWGIELVNRRRWLRQRERIEQENARELARQRSEAEREKLLLEVDNQSRELSNAALNLIRKNEAILRLKDELLAAQHDHAAEPRTVQRMVRHIDQHLESDHDWA
ncbi:MAG TPA: two-component regulator propeller domain-containing protein, partial [Saprospiraceae bacterium]|nr:two-component regulator propeller domain-containing protein [Saprospiraceae bacterium]